MLKTIPAIIKQGKIEFLEEVSLVEGGQILVTFLSDEINEFWLEASQTSLDAIWDDDEDDIYAQLLEK